MTLQEIQRIKALAVELEDLMVIHAAMRETAKTTQICDVEAAIPRGGNGLATTSNTTSIRASSAPMKDQIYALVRRLTRWAA